MQKNNYGFFGSRLNTILLFILIILMIMALRFMYQNKQWYFSQNVQPAVVVPEGQSNTAPSVKQKQPKSITLTAKENSKTETVSLGDMITITLGNPGDGGYQFETPVYDSTLFVLKNHAHTDPAVHVPGTPVIVGDFGSDTWQFVSLAKGVSKIKINSIRGSDQASRENMFTTTVTVR